MGLLIVEPLEADVVQWLAERHAVQYAPELAADPQALRAALLQVQALVLPPHVPLEQTLLRHAPRLRVVARMSAGPENIDIEACRAARVEVVRSLTATASAEAEFVIGALLALLRRVPVLSSDGMLVGRELGCATVGLIGMSPAARMLAQQESKTMDALALERKLRKAISAAPPPKLAAKPTSPAQKR